MPQALHAERGGGGEPLLVLLHGLGANATVWRKLLPLVGERWPGSWIAPDLRGHGRSLRAPPYGYGIHAADIATLIAETGAADVTVLGHSFGGLIAALVGTGWFGVNVARVACVGVKIVWSDEEVAKAREIALRPARAFATRAEATERALKVAGLFGLMDPNSTDAAVGVRDEGGRFTTAYDPRAAGGVGPSVETILTLCAAPLRLSAGENDPMVSLADMRRVDPAAVVIRGAGHNAHWEAPAAVWKFFEEGGRA